jgi:hypothetical protein
MKSRELYSGAAPSAMGQMGSGLMEMGANVGRITASGYEAMGKGIASGISSAGQAYGQYKQAKASNDITRSMINDPEYGKMLGLDPTAPDYEDKKKSMLNTLDQTIKSHGQFGGAQFSKQYLGPIQEYAAIGRSYKQQMDMAQKQAEVLRTMPFYNMGASALGETMRDVNRPNKALGVGGGVAPGVSGGVSGGTPEPTQNFGGYPSNPSSSNEVISPYDMPSGTPVSGGRTSEMASSLFPDAYYAPRRFDYENLLPEHKAYVDASTFGKEHWNVLGEEQQIKNLMNIDKPNFGLTRSRR